MLKNLLTNIKGPDQTGGLSGVLLIANAVRTFYSFDAVVILIRMFLRYVRYGTSAVSNF